MARALHAIKKEPGFPEVSPVNYKNEPTDQPEELWQLKIINVYSIVKIEPGTESCEDSKVIRRSSDKSSLTVASDELAQDVPTSGRRYGLRKQSGPGYCKHLDDPNKVLSPRGKTNKEELPLNSVNNKNVLLCAICSVVFFSLESLEDHVVDAHAVDKEFQCKECTKSFISQDKLDSHITEHMKNIEMQTRQTCPICCKTLASKVGSQLKRHMMTHLAVRPYKCKSCPKSYFNARKLDIHEMNQHGKPKKFKCPKCSKTFARKYRMEDHVRTHSNDKTMVCDICGSCFKTKKTLTNHKSFCKRTNSTRLDE